MAINISETKIETSHLVMPGDLNGAGALFGGRLMEWMDTAAAISAMSYAHGPVVTGTIDSLVFYKGAKVGDIILLCARVTHMWHSSMEVMVRVHVKHLNGTLELINKAYFVMVTVPDAEGKRPVLEELICQSEEEKLEWENAEIRNMLRKERRADGV